MARECVECERLWREYSNATAEHIRLVSAYQDAARQGNESAARSLYKLLASAESLRLQKRRELAEHDCLHRAPRAA